MTDPEAEHIGQRVLVIGNFDGVHLGHRHMIATARELAESLATTGDSEVWACTFWPHPRRVLGIDPPRLLTGRDERRALLKAAGVDRVEEAAFTGWFQRQTPDEFIRDWLIDTWHATGVVVGENFRFGHRASGTATLLRETCREHGITVKVLPLVDDGDRPVSSSRIRAALDAGDLEAATGMLGRNYRYEGRVVPGAKRGRTLGYPTLNVAGSPDRLVPADGVYAGWVHDIASHPWPAAISVGTNPQFTAGDGPSGVEAFLIDYDGDDLYGRDVTVEFESLLRRQKVFSDVDGLIDQMGEDVATAREIAARAGDTR